MEHTFFDLANPRQLEFRTPGDAELNQALNGAIYLFSPDSLTHLSSVDPSKVGKATVAVKPLRDILDRRDEKGLFGWTLCMVPTRALAEHASLSMARYSREVIRACFLDQDDPVAQLRHLGQLMRGEEDRSPSRLALHEQIADVAPPHRVQSRGHFVQNENPGFAQKRLGDSHPLEHAFGKLAQEFVFPALETHFFE